MTSLIPRGRMKFDVSASYGGNRSDQQYRADLQIGKMVTAHVQYQRSTRRLDHDPLSYVDAASNIGGTFVVEHTDTDSFAEYGFDYGLLLSRIEIVVPKIARAPPVRQPPPGDTQRKPPVRQPGLCA